MFDHSGQQIEQFCIEVSNRFAALEDFNAEVELIVPGK
jgi:hypothetical protein